MEKRYQVFISSTFKDLKEERKATIYLREWSYSQLQMMSNLITSKK